MLVQFHHFCRVADISVGKLRDVNESVLVDTDVYKCAKVGYVCHDAVKFHSCNQVANFLHVRVEIELL